MFHCNYCPEVAYFKCQQDKFCRPHRENHDVHHRQRHYFEDVYCRITPQQREELNEEVLRRIRQLKNCKNAISQATARYISQLQRILADRISEIDKILKTYVDLLEKFDFTKNDIEQIEEIFMSKVSVKTLEPFDKSIFEDYLKQEILVKRGLELSNLNLQKGLEWSRTLGFYNVHSFFAREIKITRDLKYGFVCNTQKVSKRNQR